MFKYLIRLFTVFSLLFPLVTHAIVSTTTELCPNAAFRMPAACTSSAVYDDSCYRPLGCDTVDCEVTYNGCNVSCTWPACIGTIITPIDTAEICKKEQVPAGCLSVSYDDSCSESSNPCQLGDDDCGCNVTYDGCNATCEFNCGAGYYITSRTDDIIGKTCAKCADGCTCDGVFEDCSCDGQVINGVCVSCPNGLVENGVCVDCTKNGTCLNGKFTGCNENYIKYHTTTELVCVTCGDRCMENSTCPLYGTCFTDTSGTGPEFDSCDGDFTMDLNLDAGTVKCQCTGNTYIDNDGQCVDCWDNATCKDEKITGCKSGFQKVIDDSGNLIGCAGCTPNGTCSDGVFQYCNDNYYGDENGCYKCPDFASLTGKSTPGSNKVIGDCRVTTTYPNQLGEDSRGFFYFENDTCKATKN